MSGTILQTPFGPYQYGTPLSLCGAPPYRSVGRLVLDNKQKYWMEYSPDHPKATRWGYVPVHRLVAEHCLGRPMRDGEIVHHEDRDKRNNSESNLWVFPSQSEHAFHHKRTESPKYDPQIVEALRQMSLDRTIGIREASARIGIGPITARRICRANGIDWKRRHWSELTEESVRVALLGRSTAEAAKLLGVHHQTLRNRFSQLLAKRAAPGSLEPHREEIRNLAKTTRAGELALRYGVSDATMRLQIQKWELQEPDAWSEIAAFQRSRLGIRWRKKHMASRPSDMSPQQAERPPAS